MHWFKNGMDSWKAASRQIRKRQAIAPYAFFLLHNKNQDPLPSHRIA